MTFKMINTSVLYAIAGSLAMSASAFSMADPISFVDKAAAYQGQTKDHKLVYPFASGDTPAAKKINQDIAAQLYFDQVLDVAAVNANAGKDIVGYQVDSSFPNFTQLRLLYWPDENEEVAQIKFLFHPQTADKINVDEFFNENQSNLDALKKQFIAAFSQEKETLIQALNSQKNGKALEAKQSRLLHKYKLDTQNKRAQDLWLQSLTDQYGISYYCQTETLSELSVINYIEWSKNGNAVTIDCTLKAHIEVNEKTFQLTSWKFSYPITDQQQAALLSPYGKCLLSDKLQNCAKLAKAGIKAGNSYSIKDVDGRSLDLYIASVEKPKKGIPKIYAVLLDGYAPVTRLFPLESKSTDKLYLRDDYRRGENDLKLIIPYDENNKKADFSKALWQKK